MASTTPPASLDVAIRAVLDELPSDLRTAASGAARDAVLERFLATTPLPRVLTALALTSSADDAVGGAAPPSGDARLSRRLALAFARVCFSSACGAAKTATDGETAPLLAAGLAHPDEEARRRRSPSRLGRARPRICTTLVDIRPRAVAPPACPNLSNRVDSELIVSRTVASRGEHPTTNDARRAAARSQRQATSGL